MSDKTIADHELIQKIKDAVDESDWDELCGLAEYMFGGRFTYEADLDEAVLTPNDDYSGAFGELQWEVEASFYDMNEDPGTPYAQKKFYVMANDVDAALEKAEAEAWRDEERYRSNSCKIEMESLSC